MGKAMTLRERLVQFRDNRALKEGEALVTQLMEGDGRFALWGVGNTGICTRRFFDERSEGKLRPEYIIDNNPALWGRDQVISPEEFFRLKNAPPILVVAVYVSDQVLEQIRGYGYTGKVSCLNLTSLFGDEDIWRLYEDHFEELETLYGLLADERSRDTLAGFLNYIRTLDDRYLERINGDSREKLMDAVLLDISGEEFFVDVGAFVGDTIEAFLKASHGSYREILAIEPDRENYSALCQYIENRGMERVTLKQLAVGEKAGTAYFRSGVSESCRLSENGAETITLERLDEIAEAEKATLIKISSNGQDLNVLKGAQALIMRNSPKISAYASGSLLWEIPLYLKKLNPAYRIYYRHYGMGRQAMICYAVV